MEAFIAVVFFVVLAALVSKKLKSKRASNSRLDLRGRGEGATRNPAKAGRQACPCDVDWGAFEAPAFVRRGIRIAFA